MSDAPKRDPNPSPNPSPNIVELLRELERERADEGMPVGARNRVQLAIAQRESRRRARWRRWVPAASFAAGAALVLAVLGARVGGSPAEAEPASLAVASASVPTVGAFAVEPGCVQSTADGVAQLDAHCRLVAPHMTVEVWEPSGVQADARNVRVASGKVLFDVEPVPVGEASVEVSVSHGRIEVVGTRFAVEQGSGGGHVDLLEGEIRFHHPDGRVDTVLPGERLSWGDQVLELPPAPEASDPEVVEVFDIEPSPAARPRARRRVRGSSARAAAVIERVTELRADKRYGAAISELRRALRRNWDRRTAQVLSYELGELLRAAEDTVGACDHFAAHQRKYPQGRYATAIDRVLDRLDCD